jgi:hypothetical protein
MGVTPAAELMPASPAGWRFPTAFLFVVVALFFAVATVAVVPLVVCRFDSAVRNLGSHVDSGPVHRS